MSKETVLVESTDNPHISKITIMFHKGFTSVTGYVFSDEAGIFDNKSYPSYEAAVEALLKYCENL